jgi:hypothetical protein
MAHATVAPSGEIAAELGVLVFPRVSINAPMRASLGAEEVVWACVPDAVPRANTARIVEKRRLKEHVRTSTKVMGKA